MVNENEPCIAGDESRKQNKLDRVQWAHQEINRFADMIRKGRRCKLVLSFADDERLAFLEHWQPVVK